MERLRKKMKFSKKLKNLEVSKKVFAAYNIYITLLRLFLFFDFPRLGPKNIFAITYSLL
jgi:hypothetical protein